MLPGLRVLFAAACGILCLSTAARADEAADPTALAAISAARGGDWIKAYAEAAQDKDPLALKLVRWLDDTRGTPGSKFADIAAFIDQNPDWPQQKTLRRRAEAALDTENDETADAYLQRHPPVSGAGRVRAARILIDRGQNEAGAAALRSAWIEDDFTIAEERAVLTRFGSLLRTEDHRQRLDRLLWDGQSDTARRMLPLIPAEYRPLAEARLALEGEAAAAPSLLAKVPAAQRSDPGLAFDEARWDRKKGNYEAAAQLLLAHSDEPVQPWAWWNERLLVARWLLAGAKADDAYRLLQQAGAGGRTAETEGEAEFLLGYIEMRYRKNTAAALDHFAHLLAQATSPYARARADYWSGRAATAESKPDLARKWYTAGAENMATFYGQLSAHELGKDAPPHPVPEPRPSPADQAAFDKEELVRATQLLFAGGDRDHARVFLMQLGKHAKTPVDFTMLAALAEAHGRIDMAIAIARSAIDKGMPLMLHGYPVTKLPDGGTAEHSLLLAIVRQESAFAPDAMSRVGARGLMQLMPATAAGIAAQLQLPFSLARLTTDGIYNVTLGRSYIERLLDDFGGSYALAIAAYNAGPGRVKQWLHDFGDPRGTDIRMVDWIELIPFNETRTYVQRVLENLQIYRGQNDGNASAFSLVSDLAR